MNRLELEKILVDYKDNKLTLQETTTKIMQLPFQKLEPSYATTLEQERAEIHNWMNDTKHPSEYIVWTDQAERASKMWTEKGKRLKEIEELIGKI